MIPKVLAYITRQRPDCTEVLVFRHVAYPEAGIQVPGGTVNPGELLEVALLREVAEETGLRGCTFLAKWRPLLSMLIGATNGSSETYFN